MYTAVINKDTTGREDVVQAAWPAVLSVTVLSAVAPFLNVTVPVGTPLPGELAVTVALKVTGCPYTDGLEVLLSEVEVESLPTNWTTCTEVLIPKLALPL